MENKGSCEVLFPSNYILVSPQVNKNGELCKQMKTKSSSWKPITNDLWETWPALADSRIRALKSTGLCVFRQMWWGKVSEDFGWGGEAKLRKFMAVLYTNVFVNYFIKYLD